MGAPATPVLFVTSRSILGAVCAALAGLSLGGCPVDQTDRTIPDVSSSSFGDAQGIELSDDGKATLTGSLSTGAALDIYDLGFLEPGDRVIIDVRTTSGDLDPVAALFDEDENLVAFNDDRQADASDLDPLIDLVIRAKAGNYFVGVAPFASAGGSGVYKVNIDVLRGVGASEAKTQVVFLDWNGGDGVVIANVGTFDLDPFSAVDLGLDASRTDVFKSRVAELVADRYAGYNLVLLNSDDHSPPPAAHSTVYFGGFSRQAFAISEQIDAANADPSDNAIVFTSSFRGAFTEPVTFNDLTTAVANTVAHEIGHLLGMVHTKDCDDLMDTTCGNDSILRAQEFSRAVLDTSVFPIGFQDAEAILEWVLGFSGV